MAAICTMPSCGDCNDDNNITPSNNNGNNEEQYQGQNEDELTKSLACAKVMPEESNNYEEAQRLRKKARDFYWKFTEKVGASTSDNFSVSPMSAFLVMGMAAESANGQTQKEILDALGLSADEIATLAPILSNDLNKTLGDYDLVMDGDQQADNKPQNLIKSVNSIWACDEVHYNEKGLKKIASDFYCDLFWTDFKSGEGNKLINSYIKNETRGFLDIDFEISKETVLALLNVLYIKEVWNDMAEDLQESDKKYDFVNSDNSTTSKSLLSGSYRVGRATSETKYKKFYTTTNSGYRLVFTVPNDGYTVADIYNYECLSAPKEGDAIDGKTRYITRCLFPEFKTSFLSTIKKSIMDMGVKQLFVEGFCDFSNLVDSVDGISGQYPLFCSDIKQATRFEVSKSGIEGAAATIMLMEKAESAFEEYNDVYEDFIVDRAFAFAFEDYYGNVLFSGVVNKVE